VVDKEVRKKGKKESERGSQGIGSRKDGHDEQRCASGGGAR